MRTRAAHTALVAGVVVAACAHFAHGETIRARSGARADVAGDAFVTFCLESSPAGTTGTPAVESSDRAWRSTFGYFAEGFRIAEPGTELDSARLALALAEPASAAFVAAPVRAPLGLGAPDGLENERVAIAGPADERAMAIVPLPSPALLALGLAAGIGLVRLSRRGRRTFA
jgi:hypothetical protein